MSQMENELIVINAPDSPVVERITPAPQQGGMSFGTLKYSNNLGIYQKMLMDNIKTTATAFQTLVDVARKRDLWETRNEIDNELKRRTEIGNQIKMRKHLQQSGRGGDWIPESMEGGDVVSLITGITEQIETAQEAEGVKYTYNTERGELQQVGGYKYRPPTQQEKLFNNPFLNWQSPIPSYYDFGGNT